MKTNGFYFTIFIVIFVIISGIGYAQENLIKNPSFEVIGANGNPEHWSTHSWIKGEAVTRFSVDQDIAYTGNKSVVVDNLQRNHGYYVQAVPVNKNSFYRLTGWVKTEKVGEKVEGAGISVIGYFEVGGDIKGTSNWKLAELYVSTGPRTSMIEIMLQVGNYGAENTGKAWFDEISITKMNSLPPGVKVTEIEDEEEDTSQSKVEEDTKEEKVKDTKTKGTFTLFIIIIIVVIVVGLVVIIFIILTRKKPGMLEDNEDAEKPEDDVSDPEKDET